MKKIAEQVSCGKKVVPERKQSWFGGKKYFFPPAIKMDYKEN
jgi:hypothetical protein